MQHNSTVEPSMWILDEQGRKCLAHGSIPVVKLTLLPHFKEVNETYGKALGKWAKPEKMNIKSDEWWNLCFQWLKR